MEIFTKKNDENSIKKLNLQDAKEIFLRVYKPTMFSCSIDKQPKELQFQKNRKDKCQSMENVQTRDIDPHKIHLKNLIIRVFFQQILY